ncbi:haloacid dehalogenase type II [Halobaculum sp. WSA2]|uniref:Haloacid dehalogenase type II n=1 Tax=Halobaculum saliterrae TaxID=2073113 RepID=A0A6B0T0N8_9EURY|nr:haloacid dehalogenase type II [Halobaculum saliterrae]MXR41810.1 haloacid dehalogenase type II [Halobaculum saliterrae]
MAETLCFDMYGTLCDTSSVTSTLAAELDAPETLVAEIDATWRAKQLQYSYQSALMEEYQPFWEVTGDALAYALDQWGVDADGPTRERILAAYEHLDPYPDAIETLTRLSEAGHTVTVLSNGNPEMLETLADNAGLAPHLHDVISADEVSTFKPNPAVYENAAARTDTPIDRCRLVSGNAWDVAGAGSAGMRTAWVNRANDPFEEIGVAPSLEVTGLAGVADELA